MSDALGSNIAPESMLRFSFDELNSAGKRLGPVKSTLTPPKTTFEELQRRANALLRRAHEREARRLTLQRTCAIALIAFGALLLTVSSSSVER